MCSPRLLLLPILLAFTGAIAAAPPAGSQPAPASTQASSATAPTEAEMRQAIRELNHPSPTKRRDAVRRLADWGPLAFDALAKVAAGPDLEPALLARDLLEQMGEVLFIGARVRLEADRTRIKWDEPVNLTLQVENPTPAAIIVPWPVTSSAAATQPTAYDAHQVGEFMDLADFLTILAPEGEEIEPRVDPIEQDSAVFRAVTVRAGDHPPSHPVAAGATERLTVHAVNRGWARYPLLRPGKHTIRFAYQPQWKDPAWIAQGFGLIESNPVVIEVTEPAPEEVRAAERPLQLLLRRDGAALVGELQNTWDRDFYLNLNIGGPTDTHARLEWVPLARGDQEATPFSMDSDATGPQFAADRVRRIAPGEKVAITRAPADLVRRQARTALNDNTGAVEVLLKYTHLPTTQDLRRALREKGRHETVPGRLFSGSAAADPIPLDGAR